MEKYGMIVTRHISLDNDCIEKMQPYIEKHKGNFSAAIREIIDIAKEYNSLTNFQAIDSSLFKWVLAEIDGVLLPDNVLDKLIDPTLINSMGNLEKYLKNRFRDLRWDIDIMLKYDNDSSPSELIIDIRGNPQKIKFASRIVCQYLIKNLPENSSLEIRSINNIGDYIIIDLSKANKSDAQKSLTIHFGEMDEVIKAIKDKPQFWKAIINGHLLSNYSMVTVHRNYFEDLLANKIPMGEITIETMAKRPIKEIPLNEILCLIKDVYETSRVVDRVEVDKENIILFHNYRNKDVIEKLKKSLIMLLDANGHSYDAKSTANMIVLIHNPDIGIKINQLVNDLKISNNRIDQDLIVLMAFLKGLKNIYDAKASPDLPLSLTLLGRKIGKSLMQNYEKEYGVKIWELQDFKKALEIIDSRLQRESDLKLDGKELTYTIKKCSIIEGSFDPYMCHAIRDTFKGAVEYVFGNRAELGVKKLLSHGDNLCEVIVKLS